MVFSPNWLYSEYARLESEEKQRVRLAELEKKLAALEAAVPVALSAARAEAYQEGVTEGYADGYHDGYVAGWSEYRDGDTYGEEDRL